MNPLPSFLMMQLEMEFLSYAQRRFGGKWESSTFFRRNAASSVGALEIPGKQRPQNEKKRERRILSRWVCLKKTVKNWFNEMFFFCLELCQSFQYFAYEKVYFQNLQNFDGKKALIQHLKIFRQKRSSYFLKCQYILIRTVTQPLWHWDLFFCKFCGKFCRIVGTRNMNIKW